MPVRMKKKTSCKIKCKSSCMKRAENESRYHNCNELIWCEYGFSSRASIPSDGGAECISRCVWSTHDNNDENISVFKDVKYRYKTLRINETTSTK